MENSPQEQQANDTPEELLPLVDGEDNVIGTILGGEYVRELFGEQPRGYVRSADVFIINSQGQLWIPRRSLSKKNLPGALDFSSGGHVGADETYEVAVKREVFEEIGIEADFSHLVEIGKLPPVPGQPWFSKVFTYQSDDVPSYNPDDFSGFEWLTPEALAARVEGGETSKHHLLRAVELLIAHRA